MSRLSKFLTYAGIVGIVFGLARFHADLHDYEYSGRLRVTVAVIYVLFLVVASYGAGIPDLPRSRRSAITSAVFATGAAAVGMSLLQLFIGDLLLPRLVVFGAAVLLMPWFVICIALSAGGLARAQDRSRVLLVAEPDEAAALERDLKSADHLGVRLARVFTTDEAHSHEERRKKEREESRPIPDHGTLLVRTAQAIVSSGRERVRPLWEWVWMTEATTLVLARKAQADDDIVEQASFLHESGMRVRSLARFYEESLGKLPLSELERLSLFFDIREVHGDRYRPVKRILDVTAAVIGMLLLVVLTPLIFVGNLFGNRGPLFYRQPRVGKENTEFQILKFRTMRVQEHEDLTNWTIENDPRITPFGRLLRATHLDELPQVVNLLRGDLSIVGPRPEQPHYVQQLSKTVPFYYFRHLVRPGLTGWAQVNYGYGASDDDTLEKLQYEFYYLRHQSLWLDLRIIGRTIRSVLNRRGR
jgi:exopolysaccharide biosynthesis polyprenyl glycosylphosphotransferase